MSIELTFLRVQHDGAPLTTSVWRVQDGRRCISSAMLGGGIGSVGWVVNMQVPGGYARMDPVDHLLEVAAEHGLQGRGVGMMTAAAVDRTFTRVDGGVSASATVGLRVPTWAAAPLDGEDPELAPMVLPRDRYQPGTINITVDVPVALSDGALVNAVMTVTEAKTQALLEAGYPATGTASDACVVVCRESGEPESFAGPRSEWGGAIARAVHAAVSAGAEDYTVRLRRRSL